MLEKIQFLHQESSMRKSIKRVLGWDLFRILQIYPIIHFHTLEAFLYKDLEPVKYFDSALYWLGSSYSRLMSTGGLNIVAISFFIMGVKSLNKKRFKFLIPLLVLGVLALNVAYAYSETGSWYFEWDIYHYLIAMIIIVYIFDHYRRYAKMLLPVFFFLSIFPFWELNTNFMNKDVEQILVGVCGQDAFGIWALFPWGFWALFFWSLGVFYNESLKKRIEGLPNSFAVVLFVSAIGLYLIASFSHFYYTPVGPGFSCFIHRPPKFSFLMHYFALIFLFTLASSERINIFLTCYFSFLTKFYWNRNFGLTYLSHILVLSLSVLLIDLSKENGGLFIVFVLIQFFAAELMARCAVKLYRGTYA